MDVSRIQQDLSSVPSSQRVAAHAKLLRGLSGFAQIGLMVALFVMWKQFRMPFATAFTRCFIAGVLVYVTLGMIASLMLTLARLQPLQLLLRHLVGVISLLIFLALHYVYHLGIFQSVVAWVVIYVATRILVSRIEARAMRGFSARG